VKAAWEDKVKLQGGGGVGFVKEAGFKPGVRDGVRDVQSGKTEEGVMGAGIGESEVEELVPD